MSKNIKEPMDKAVHLFVLISTVWAIQPAVTKYPDVWNDRCTKNIFNLKAKTIG